MQFEVIESEAVRYHEDEDGMTCYTNTRGSVNFQGMTVIADHYNQKYFSNSERKIVLTKSVTDAQEKIIELLRSDNVIVGFTIPSNDSLDSHPIPIIFEKHTNGLKSLYIADSAGVSTFDPELKDFCLEHDIKLFVNAYARQADNGSCRSEALAYLKNALQQDSIVESVKRMNTEQALTYFNQGFEPQAYTKEQIEKYQLNVFLESPDMLKTVQSRSAIKNNGIDVSEPLQSTKLKISFQDKLDPYTREVIYVKGDFSEPNHPEKKAFWERDYLRNKTRQHAELMKNIVETTDEEELENIETRGCSLTLR
ncbi:hypothetical protein [uncultured Legionella sp.]|uniref:hypothetical protein n=1 Tax=uncultured Legionella sp. TaxID=210934 RepID=UPI00260CF80B|nr:hypothetical protein [uncultured Legionella sp.]